MSWVAVVSPVSYSRGHDRASRTHSALLLLGATRRLGDVAATHEAMADIVQLNLAAAHALSARYGGRGVAAAALRETAELALIRAACLSPGPATDFLAHALPALRHEVRLLAAPRRADMRGGLDPRERRLLQWRFVDRPPSRELADRLALSEAGLTRATSQALRRLCEPGGGEPSPLHPAPAVRAIPAPGPRTTARTEGRPS